MSSTNAMPFPYGIPSSNYNDFLEALQNQAILGNMNNNTNKLSDEIYNASDKVTNLSSAQTLGLRDAVERTRNDVSKDIYNVSDKITGLTGAQTLGLRDAIERSRNDVTKDIYNASDKITGLTGAQTLGLRDAIERNHVADQTTMERIGSNTLLSVERNGANAIHGIERSNGAIQTTIERVGANNMAAVERSSGITQSAIERVAGENRITTVTTDAASRQSANDTARDLAVSIERNGANSISNTDKVNALVLDAINRAAAAESISTSENRLLIATTDAAARQALHDTRRDINDTVNRGTNELFGLVNSTANENRLATLSTGTDLRNQIMNSLQIGQIDSLKASAALAQQSATQHAQGILEGNRLFDSLAAQNSRDYASTILEQQKSKELLASKGDMNYASLLLEGQKSKEHLAAQNARDYASLLIEGQKSKEHILSKTDTNYASLIIEGNRNKEMLATQAANQFAINQLEQQKIKESLSAQIQDVKYEGLKNKDQISMQLAECCCDIKTTVRGLDENRVRDALNVERNEVNLLKTIDRFRDHNGYNHGGHDHEPRRMYNINNSYYDDYDRRDHGGRGDRRGRGHDDDERH